MIILYRGSIKLFRAIMKFSHATILIVLFSILSFWMANAYFAPPDFAAYYSYTRSLLHDGDLDFSDEYEHFEFQKHMLYIPKNLGDNFFKSFSQIIKVKLIVIFISIF